MASQSTWREMFIVTNKSQSLRRKIDVKPSGFCLRNRARVLGVWSNMDTKQGLYSYYILIIFIAPFKGQNP